MDLLLGSIVLIHCFNQVQGRSSSSAGKTDADPGDASNVTCSGSCAIYRRLYDHVSENTFSYGLPTNNLSAPVDVWVDVSLNHIINLDHTEQSLMTSIWMRQYWHDAGIAWDPADYGNITSIHTNAQDVWVPDIFVYNIVEQDLMIEDIKNFDVVANYDGYMTWLYPLQVTTSCRMDVTYFPFDTQHCLLDISTWTYSGNQVHVKNFTSGADLKDYKAHGQWRLDYASFSPYSKYYSSVPGVPYYGIYMEIVISRMQDFYILTICFPTLLMLILLLFGILIPAESEGKVNLGVTLFLSQIVLALIVTEYIPIQSLVTPLMLKFMTVVLIDMTTFLLLNALVLGLYNKSLESCHLPLIISHLFLNDMMMCIMMPEMFWEKHCRPNKNKHKSKVVLTSHHRRLSTFNAFDNTIVDETKKEPQPNGAIPSQSCQLREHNDLSSLEVEEVILWLQKLPLSDTDKYIQICRGQNITGPVLQMCELHELKTELSMNFGDWVIFKTKLLALRDVRDHSTPLGKVDFDHSDKRCDQGESEHSITQGSSRCNADDKKSRRILGKNEYAQLATMMGRMSNIFTIVFTSSIILWLCLLSLCTPDIENGNSSCGEIIYKPW